MANPFWAKVAFSDFIRHYRKMTDEQIVADVRGSMDALEDVTGDGKSFGDFMVRCSKERIQQRSEVNRANALAGHEKRGHEIRVPKPNPLPSTDELYDFCSCQGIDDSLAREWLEMTLERGGKTRDGKTIGNWKGAVTNYVAARMKKLAMPNYERK